MKRLLLLAGALLFAGCAGTKPAEKNEFNQEYFAKVKDHFEKCGTKIPEKEVKKFTASVFIASNPPVCAIYDDSLYVGKSNVQIVYFKPGKRHLRCVKGDKKTEEVVELSEGKNKPLLVVLK